MQRTDADDGHGAVGTVHIVGQRGAVAMAWSDRSSHAHRVAVQRMWNRGDPAARPALNVPISSDLVLGRVRLWHGTSRPSR